MFAVLCRCWLRSSGDGSLAQYLLYRHSSLGAVLPVFIIYLSVTLVSVRPLVEHKQVYVKLRQRTHPI